MFGLVSILVLSCNPGSELIGSCLDDPELALLGVPWETYRQVANDIGLDVIRLVLLLAFGNGRSGRMRQMLITVFRCLMDLLRSH